MNVNSFQDRENVIPCQAKAKQIQEKAKKRPSKAKSTPSIGLVLTKSLPLILDQNNSKHLFLTKYWPSISQVLANRWPCIGKT